MSIRPFSILHFPNCFSPKYINIPRKKYIISVNHLSFFQTETTNELMVYELIKAIAVGLIWSMSLCFTQIHLICVCIIEIITAFIEVNLTLRWHLDGSQLWLFSRMQEQAWQTEHRHCFSDQRSSSVSFHSIPVLKIRSFTPLCVLNVFNTIQQLK